MDRTVATGTGFVGQYPLAVQSLYESAATTPDDLLLFFHHVPYTYALRSGKTVIQHIYDSHYEGGEQAEEFVQQWKLLRTLVDGERYNEVLTRLEYQAGHAIVWRDAICDWFFRTSGIPDAKGRVGNHPDRIEAEAMQLEGYVPVDVDPWENASGGKGIECKQTSGCSAQFRFERAAGRYEMNVRYFDQNNGVSKFQVLVNGTLLDEWIAGDHLPATKPNGDSSTSRRISAIALHPGDEIRIQGFPDAQEYAPLDYIELHPAHESR
jgi:alpha-glucuronidase